MITVGVDEVGRGCWAGPLVAGAVVLKAPLAGLRDSKVLSKKQRQNLNDLIRKEAAAIGLGWVWPKEIDSGGITLAVKTAMQRAVAQITDDYDEIIIDGNFNFLSENSKVSTLVKADALVGAVSAASIVAKVARDAYMEEMASVYPEYGFERHVGYGTAHHIKALTQYGVTDIHRLSYKPIKALLK